MSRSLAPFARAGRCARTAAAPSWWHNTLFHGKAEDCGVVHFRHQSAFQELAVD